MAESAEPFGKPRRVSHLAPVPMFDPLLKAARDLVQTLEWFGREVEKAESLCTSMESVTAELLESKIAEDASRQIDAAVRSLRQRVEEARGYHARLGRLASELHGGDDDTFKLGRIGQIASGAASE